MEQKTVKPKIEFILTGFGAFGSHLTNPTSILIEKVLQNKNDFIVSDLYSIGPCEIVYVAAQDCEAFYDRTNKYIDERRKEGSDALFIIIHCGANFSIPDNRNNQFTDKQIVEKFPSEHHFRTMIPATPICSALKKEGFAVQLSEDPGRYICNYLYYLSLFHGFFKDVPSLFVHFPTHANIDEQNQAGFLGSLLQNIALEYSR